MAHNNKKALLQVEEDGQLTIKGRRVEGKDFKYHFEDKTTYPIPSSKQEKVSTYILNKELVDAVNAAIITGRPLLLKGEPGCGKTKLAKAVASYFYEEKLADYYFEWHIKSKSRAKEGAYTFDQVSRLRDATIAGKDKAAKNRVSDPKNYISLGPMGSAFTVNSPDGYTPILLIDEIDKGDIDFPNDLLLELDEMRFKIGELTEADQFIEAKKRPLVFITSNDERELPPAFLRRCLYYKIPSFEDDLLIKIVNAKLADLYKEEPAYKELSKNDVTSIVHKFQEIKQNSTASASKMPSTSELIDWLKLLFYVFNESDNQKKIADLIKDNGLQSLALKLM